ncbi:hypothetical protein KI387_038233, partial [Taxus chinensis]
REVFKVQISFQATTHDSMPNGLLQATGDHSSSRQITPLSRQNCYPKFTPQ